MHFRIAYEINPWMRLSNAVNGPRALDQWRTLCGTLRELGVTVELVEQRPDVPDMTFTANAGVVMGRRFLPANFRYPERQAEEPYFSEWFRERGYTIEALPEEHYWEGEGDVLPAGARVFGGHGFRTEERVFDQLDTLMGVRIDRLQLVDPRFYHLDTCFCPIDARRAMYYPAAFAPESRAVLEHAFEELIVVPDDEALRFACNALVVDETIVLNTGCPKTEVALVALGLRTQATATDEFIKAGGSVKCLVLMLDAYPTA